MRRSSHRESGSGHLGNGRLASLGSILSAALASVLMAGALLGFVAGETSAATPPACNGSSTTTSAVKLTMTSGSFAVHGNAPSNIPGPASLTFDLNPKTGAISEGTLSPLTYHVSGAIATTSTETIIISQVTSGAGTGSLNYLGDISYSASLKILITIHAPASEQCTMSPTTVHLVSTTPYSSGSVTLAQKGFTIPPVKQTGTVNTTPCLLAGPTITKRFSGSVNEFSVSLTGGTLPLPPPPAKPTVTTLTVTPPGQVLAGTTPVTLSASVSATGVLAKAATGTVTFKDGPTVVGDSPIETGKATLTSSTLPTQPDQSLTAVYSGDTKYAASTSAPEKYTVFSRPTVSTNLPVTAIRGTSTPTAFNVRVTNPLTGKSWTNLKLALRLRTIDGQTPTNVTLQYENNTDVWCKLPLRHITTIKGTFTRRAGACVTPTTRTTNLATHFSLPAGQALTIPFRITFASGANVGTQTVIFVLETVTQTSPTGTVIRPFTTTTVNGVPTYAPYTTGHIQVNPATKYSVTMHMAPNTTVPQGYSLVPSLVVTHPANVTPVVYPTARGTVRFLVTGRTVTPPFTVTGTLGPNGPLFGLTSRFSTKGLSVGTHTLTAVYSGDGVYNPNRVTATFTVIAANSGAVFQCSKAHEAKRLFIGSVVASAALPATTSSGSVTASLVAVTVHMDAAVLRTTIASFPAPVTDITITFSPGGSVTVPASALSLNGDTATLSLSHLSATIPGITGSLGTVVPVSVSAVSFHGGTTVGTGKNVYPCEPITQPAPVGSVLVSGVSLAASPAGPASPGTTVTLKALSIPATKGGQVTFFDGTKALGTAVVQTSGPTEGVATLKTQPPLGSHSYHATWSGTVPVSRSNTVAYSVESVPVVTTQPAPSNVNAGATASFSAKASGTPAPTVQWQLSTDGGAQWTTISGATGTAYTTPVTTAADSGNQYRAIFTNGAGSATTNAASLTVVIPPAVVTQPASQSVVAGSTAAFTAKATGSVLNVQWQVSTNGGSSWSNAPGTPKNTFATRTTLTSTYTTPAAGTANNGNQYRAVFSNGAGTANSNAATLSVSPAPVPPVVTTQPASGTVNAGTTAVFAAAATGLPAPSVQWQVSTNGGGSWSTVPGATSTLLVVPSVPGTDNGNQYRAVFTNSAGLATSNAATLTVNVNGYRLVASNGAVYAYGDAAFYGSMGGKPLSAPIVGTASTPGDGGYWLVGSDGGIFAFGDAAFYGSMGGKPLNQPIVGIAATPDGKGYWEVASDGGIFAFGDAAFYGSMGGKPLNQPIVGIAATPDGKGYWEVASDGGIFAFGDAAFAGSTGSLTLNKPIVGMASTGNGQGYWLVAADGGVFSFGNAGFHGTVAGTTSASIVSLVPTADNGGYWETAGNGQVFQFGDATSAGTALTQTATIVAMSD